MLLFLILDLHHYKKVGGCNRPTFKLLIDSSENTSNLDFCCLLNLHHKPFKDVIHPCIGFDWKARRGMTESRRENKANKNQKILSVTPIAERLEIWVLEQQLFVNGSVA